MDSSDLNWSKQIGNMVKKDRSTLSWVFSVLTICDRTVMTTLYNTGSEVFGQKPTRPKVLLPAVGPC